MANFDRYVTPNMLNLTDSYAVKILICYFLRQINRPITPEQLTEIATADGVINYFVYTEAMNQKIAKEVAAGEERGRSRETRIAELEEAIASKREYIRTHKEALTGIDATIAEVDKADKELQALESSDTSLEEWRRNMRNSRRK